MSKLKIMNIVVGGREKTRTIGFTPGSIRGTPNGFTYCFDISTGKGVRLTGCGIVENRRYASMSPEEIELICSVENPVTPENLAEFAEINELDMKRLAMIAEY